MFSRVYSLGVFRKPLTQPRFEMNAPANTSLDITQMLREWSDGNRDALDELLPLVYEELRRQASHYLRRERPDHTLQTTALIHEAYLRLIDQREVNWQSRAHFFAISAQAMRRILVDYARTKHREKRGGDALKLPLEEAALMPLEEKSVDLMELDEALTRSTCATRSCTRHRNRLLNCGASPSRKSYKRRSIAPWRKSRASVSKTSLRCATN